MRTENDFVPSHVTKSESARREYHFVVSKNSSEAQLELGIVQEILKGGGRKKTSESAPPDVEKRETEWKICRPQADSIKPGWCRWVHAAQLELYNGAKGIGSAQTCHLYWYSTHAQLALFERSQGINTRWRKLVVFSWY